MENLIDCFIKSAELYPQQTAIIDGDESISYGKLLSLVSRLAAHFSTSDFKKGNRVGIHLVNSIEYVAAYYACWYAELVPVALNTLASSHEIENWTTHAGCSVIFSNKLDSGSTSIPICSLQVDAGNAIVNGSEISSDFKAKHSKVTADDIATIIYTSGTTGNPKGITLTQRNISTNIHAIVSSLSITREDVFLCVLPFFYSFGNSVLHTHLCTGATLVLLNNVMYPNEILRRIEQNECTGFAGVPSLYISLLKKTQFEQYNLDSLRYMTQAGGPLSAEFIDQIHQRLPDLDFVVMYGQTEASARISYLPPKHLESKLGSVGIGVDGVTVSVVDKHGAECGPDIHGEICVQGENVMLGYWRDPELTKKVLSDGKLYTGDMGYKDADGFLYIVGRQSEILKISEHRVSPYEIEEILLKHTSVEECAVTGCTHPQMGQYAKAFVIKNNNPLTDMELKKFCKQYLASYKIPKEISFVDALPKTSSGKIQRSQLPC